MFFRPSFRHIMLLLGPLLLAPLAQADLAAKKNFCMSCHQIEGRKIGPALKDVAGKYRLQPNGSAAIANSILGGSKGQWGTLAMPPNIDVSPLEARKLAAWILDL